MFPFFHEFQIVVNPAHVFNVMNPLPDCVGKVMTQGDEATFFWKQILASSRHRCFHYVVNGKSDSEKRLPNSSI